MNFKIIYVWCFCVCLLFSERTHEVYFDTWVDTPALHMPTNHMRELIDFSTILYISQKFCVAVYLKKKKKKKKKKTNAQLRFEPTTYWFVVLCASVCTTQDDRS